MTPFDVTGDKVAQALVGFVNDDLLAGTASDVGVEDEIVLDGTVDSLGVARMIGFIEAEFGVDIPAEDVTIENFRSIGSLSRYVVALIEAEPAA